MAKTDGPHHRRWKRQANRLSTSVANKRARACLSAGNVNGHPRRIANRFDLDLRCIRETAQMQLPAKLSGKRQATRALSLSGPEDDGAAARRV
jgi:hypothetical protein